MTRAFFRSAATGTLAAALMLGSLAVSTPALAQRDTSMSSARAEAGARATADSIRAAVLRVATFAGFGDTSCTPGDVRTFEQDTTGDVAKLLGRLELLVLSYGAYASLDNDAGRALLRAVLRLEGGGPGPRWDMLSGQGPHALNPILPLSLLNTETKLCVDAPGNEPDGITLPEVTGLVVPRDSGALNFTVGYGPRARNDIRNLFFSRHRNEPNAVMRLTRMTAHALWGDYAVVGVVREKELRGVVPLPKETTGATYVFHRAGGDWRLLAVSRSW